MTIHIKAQAFAEAWLQYRDNGQLPADKDSRAFCLMIDCTLSRDVDAAEVQACILQDAEQWDHAIEAGAYIQSVMAAERAAHPAFLSLIHGAMGKAANTVRKQREIERIGRDIDALRHWMDSI